MRVPKPITVDFETFGIEGRPTYPPQPVGVSIKRPGKKARYYAWGHPVGNNCCRSEAAKALAQAWEHKAGVLFQNGKFDVDVAETWFGLPVPAWDRIHDTMFLLFLDDPHQVQLGLKPAAARLLDWPAEEQDAVGEWLVANQPVPGVKISRSKSSPHYFGRYIAFAPGDLVGKYADGDVDRTEALFQLLWPRLAERDMLEAYDRERRLMPILLAMERQGLPVDLARLRSDVRTYCQWRDRLNDWVLKRLKAGPDLNLDSGPQLMAAMIDAGAADPDLVPLTKTGKYQTNKDALLLGVTDKPLLGVLKYRSQLNTCLNTFMLPWLRVAEQSGGYIFTTWNQVRAPKGADNAGTRTGRLSSTPNFQNIPNEFKPSFHHQDPKAKLPRCPFKDLPPLPRVRSYVVPFKGEVFIDRDYCFSPDTEVLTNEGFVPFPNLRPHQLIAQWSAGEITYAEPIEYQETRFKGDLIRIYGERSTDLLVTPNHQCLISKHNQTFFARADEYPVNCHGQQIHAGVVDGVEVPHQLLQLVAAIQADSANRGTNLRFYLKKERKITRLAQLLDELNIPFTLDGNLRAKPGYTSVVIKTSDLPKMLYEFIDLTGGKKDFQRKLLAAHPVARRAFLEELGLWDGTVKTVGRNWTYATTHSGNADLVQELAAVSGLRSNAKIGKTCTGKPFYSVSLRTNYLTHVKSFTKTRVPYNGLVYCVSMPNGTVVVRRNGKVMVTGNSQQEPRILAHFDGGQIMDKYLTNPWIDFHDSAQEELAKVGKIYERKPVKNTNLGLIYGMGAPKLAVKNDMTVEESADLKKAILRLYPGIKEMYAEMKRRAREDVPIRTWGGREYYCEPAKLIDGRLRQFDYKLVNVLIQGSAADCTKEAIIRYWARKDPSAKLVLNVHDQLTVSVPKKLLKREMEVLRECMESVEFDVPILSEGKVSATNWDELKDYDKKGKVV